MGVSEARAASQAQPAPSLDGVGVSPNSYCHVARMGCTMTQTLTSKNAPDIVLVVAQTFYSNITRVYDSSGLHYRFRLSYVNTYGRTLWEFYARTTAPLTRDNVTVFVSNGCCGPMSLQVLAVNGASIGQPFDQGQSVPVKVPCPGPRCGDCTANFNQGTCTATIRSSGPALVLASTAINDADPCGASDTISGPAVPGFTNLATNSNFELDYAITTVPNASVVFHCGGTDATAIVLDAIASDTEDAQ